MADSLSNVFTGLSRRSMSYTNITRLTEESKSQPISPTNLISMAVRNYQAKNWSVTSNINIMVSITPTAMSRTKAALDTDDEVEEATAANNMIKITEKN